MMASWAYVLLFPVLLAAADPPQEKSLDLQAEIEQALRTGALDGFAGTVTFVKELWSPARTGDGETAEKLTTQTWKITTDGGSRLRVAVDWHQPNYPHNEVVAETNAQIWMDFPGPELLVFDKHATRNLVELDSRLESARTILNQARAELRELLDSPTGDAPIEIVKFDHTAEGPTVVVKAGERLQTLSFYPADRALLLKSIAREDSWGSYHWSFSDYRWVSSRWVPRTVELKLRDRHGQSKRRLYSQITILPAADRPGLRKVFFPPRPGDPDFDHIRVLQQFSDQGTTMTDFHEGSQIVRAPACAEGADR